MKVLEARHAIELGVEPAAIPAERSDEFNFEFERCIIHMVREWPYCDFCHRKLFYFDGDYRNPESCQAFAVSQSFLPIWHKLIKRRMGKKIHVRELACRECANARRATHRVWPL